MVPTKSGSKWFAAFCNGTGLSRGKKYWAEAAFTCAERIGENNVSIVKSRHCTDLIKTKAVALHLTAMHADTA